MNEEIYIFCPDCRGKFEVVREDIVEGEVLECSLCGAEIEIVQEDPTKIKLLTEEEED
ncbi:lysine biosynthesis protein LysW [Candidatus Gracilibacteria bacterium]|nr:lysine biosynthesis protein LysW [Candidatus Gracilibacteria bacterium]MCF7819315.1 lysine biosynthesis protein LysW [Candidatus Gracilibacteria bacterium]